MKHFVLLFYIISFMSGMSALTLVGYIYSVKKANILKDIIISLLFFTLLLIVDVTNFYRLVFFTEEINFVRYLLMYLMLITSTGVGIFMVRIMHKVIGKIIDKKTKIMGLLLIGASFLFVILVNTVFYDKFNRVYLLVHTGYTVASIILAFSVVYSLFVVLTNKNSISDEVDSILKLIFGIVILILPIALAKNLFEYVEQSSFPVAFSPLAYLLLNSVVLYYSIMYLSSNQSSFENSEFPSFEELSTKYGITDREYEIIILVSEGATNQVIGEKLYISPNTVRNHISNVYKKLNLNNRFELMNFMMKY